MLETEGERDEEKREKDGETLRERERNSKGGRRTDRATIGSNCLLFAWLKCRSTAQAVCNVCIAGLLLQHVPAWAGLWAHSLCIPLSAAAWIDMGPEHHEHPQIGYKHYGHWPGPIILSVLRSVPLTDPGIGAWPFQLKYLFSIIKLLGGLWVNCISNKREMQYDIFSGPQN